MFKLKTIDLTLTRLCEMYQSDQVAFFKVKTAQFHFHIACVILFFKVFLVFVGL